MLYVDDEKQALDAFELALGDEFIIRTAQSAQDGLALLQKETFGLVIADERMEPTRGIDFLGDVLRLAPDTERMILSSYSDPKRVLAAINEGQIHAYLLKPLDIEKAKLHIDRGLMRAYERRQLTVRARSAERQIQRHYDLTQIVGSSGSLRTIIQRVKQVARTDESILLTGEPGTGKELFARLIHQNSPRHSGPFYVLDCAALMNSVMGEGLLGHEAGAFSGAESARASPFELAEGGTLFLDRIDGLDEIGQICLNRILEEGRFKRVGGYKPHKIDVRLISASARCMEERLKLNAFRNDLYRRLNQGFIRLPPLRERREDLPQLVEYFITKHAQYWPRPRLRPTLPSGVIEALARYHWPGNILELETLIQQAMIHAVNNELILDNFNLKMEPAQQTTPREQFWQKKSDELRALLDKHKWNFRRAAEEAKVPRTTLISQAKKYKLC